MFSDQKINTDSIVGEELQLCSFAVTAFYIVICQLAEMSNQYEVRKIVLRRFIFAPHFLGVNFHIKLN